MMVDPRSFKGDMTKIVAQDKVTDLVFMHYVFTTSFADYCKMMTNMWKQYCKIKKILIKLIQHKMLNIF